MNQYSLSIVGPSQIIFFALLLVLIPLAIYILFNISMQKAMNAVSSENRKMEGGLIWLGLIPILNIVWPYIFNAALRTSYKNEFKQKGISHKVNLASGFIYPGAQLLSIILYAFADALSDQMIRNSMYYGNDSDIQNALFFNELAVIFMSLFSLVSLVLWIIFWVNVNGLRSMLESHDRNTLSSGMNNQNQKYQETFVQNTLQVESQMALMDTSSAKSDNTNQVTQSKSEPVKQASSIDKLMKYHVMLSEGLITQADFDKVKNELLNQK